LVKIPILMGAAINLVAARNQRKRSDGITRARCNCGSRILCNI
jgi:hypothetical protein